MLRSEREEILITPEELRAVLKEHRWTIATSKSGRQQVYSAKQRRGKKLATCYIGTANKLNSLSEEDVVAKINRSAARLVSERDGNNDQTHHQNTIETGSGEATITRPWAGDQLITTGRN